MRFRCISAVFQQCRVVSPQCSCYWAQSPARVFQWEEQIQNPWDVSIWSLHYTISEFNNLKCLSDSFKNAITDIFQVTAVISQFSLLFHVSAVTWHTGTSWLTPTDWTLRSIWPPPPAAGTWQEMCVQSWGMWRVECEQQIWNKSRVETICI